MRPQFAKLDKTYSTMAAIKSARLNSSIPLRPDIKRKNFSFISIPFKCVVNDKIILRLSLSESIKTL